MSGVRFKVYGDANWLTIIISGKVKSQISANRSKPEVFNLQYVCSNKIIKLIISSIYIKIKCYIAISIKNAILIQYFSKFQLQFGIKLSS